MPAPRPGRSVADWLAHQQRLHARPIELGLERVQRVARALAVLPPAPRVITVAGTNGKGSSVALLEALLTGRGLAVAAYTSPHLLRYNERIRFAGVPIDDASLCRAFEAVEAARQGVPLTYFEFGTLAALWAIRHRRLDVALLEVGLGGRLDAVNVVDADAALLTSVDLDHMEWLGPDRERIGFEKAGVFRPGRPAVSADRDTPDSVRAHAQRIGAGFLERGPDFQVQRSAQGWRVTGPALETGWLPQPALEGAVQLDNAAGCLVVLEATGLLAGPEAVARALCEVRLAGRLQQLGEHPRRVVDVAHNPGAGAALARWLAGPGRPPGRVLLVLGMLEDKDHGGFAAALGDVVDEWFVGGIPGPRGLSGPALARAAGIGATVCDSVAQAWKAALAVAAPDDLVLATGSFLTVEAVLRLEDGGG